MPNQNCRDKISAMTNCLFDWCPSTILNSNCMYNENEYGAKSISQQFRNDIEWREYFTICNDAAFKSINYLTCVGCWQLTGPTKKTFYRFRFVFFIDFFPIHGASYIHLSKCMFHVLHRVYGIRAKIFRFTSFYFLFFFAFYSVLNHFAAKIPSKCGIIFLLFK